MADQEPFVTNKHTKGQIFSEQILVSKIFQKSNEIIARTSALASKMGQIKKVKAIFCTNS